MNMIQQPNRTEMFPKNGTKLTDLPVEILQSICGYLCLHCQIPHAVDAPGFLTRTALLGQRALASLSRTCSYLRAIAQPVLFHHYLSDPSYCVPRLPHDDSDEHTLRANLSNVRHNFRERRRVTLFLRTLLDRNDLASSVHALSLHQTPWDPFVQVYHRADVEVARLRQLESALVADVVARSIQKLLARAPGGYLTKSRGRIDDSLEFVQELVVALSVCSLEQLCIERSMFLDGLDNVPYDWRSWSYHLPKLEYLAFLGQRVPDAETYYYKEARGLVSSAPNLRTLVLPDCHATTERWVAQQWKNVSWDVSLELLTKLSLSGIRRNHLRTILAGCPFLEDLEYSCEDTGFDLDILCPEEDLAAVKGTLRRLCYSIHRANFDGTSEPELEMLDEDYYPSWTVMPALRTLEVQRALLYGPVEDKTVVTDRVSYTATDGGTPENDDDDSDQQTLPFPSSRKTCKMDMTTAEDFMSRLPPMLELLRIDDIICWPVMYRDAFALAKVAPFRFPHLRKLDLEMRHSCPPKDEIASLIGICSDANIVCRVLLEGQGGIERSFVGRSPGSATQINLLTSPEATLHNGVSSSF
ncbi:ammonia transport outward 2 [Fusarium sporotrichioides]|uniref:Ammonia transport outward 2 n=1 Tax=Fusarium sporotrichioides TaxID=5514 RepID=A0A395SB89_FUSSP|nr:ammonia transport outward 2 [Fusarium sporotrichioides]